MRNLSTERQGYIPFRIYLAGPIFNTSDRERQGWRLDYVEDIKVFIEKKFGNSVKPEFINPEYLKMTARQSENIVIGDLQSIRSSDLVIANMWKPSIGTSMEIMYAHNAKVECITFNPTSNPWSDYFGGHIVDNRDKMLHRIEKIITDKVMERDRDVDFPIQIF